MSLLNKLDVRLADWRRQLQASSLFDTDDLAELESHLLDEIDALSAVLTPDEAFDIATKRLGHPCALADEYDKVGSAAQWRPRLVWMAVGALLLLFAGALNNLILPAVLAFGAQQGASAVELSIVAILMPVALLAAIYLKRQTLFSVAGKISRDQSRVRRWLFVSIGISLFVLTAEAVEHGVILHLIGGVQSNQVSQALHTSSFALLSLLPLLIASLAVRANQYSNLSKGTQP